MSEYWVSHKRYQCKYCNIYIADDKPSRQQHENGLRHKGNVERFVRGLYKEGEKRVREREEEKGIMASVGKAAEAAYALDVASGRAGTLNETATGSAAPKAKAKAGKPSDPYANYSTPGSLGYTDPDADARQQRMGAGEPGAWTVVETRAEVPAERAETGTKRAVEEEEEAVMGKKTAAVGLGEVYDPGRSGGEAGERAEAEPNTFRKRRRRQL